MEGLRLIKGGKQVGSTTSWTITKSGAVWPFLKIANLHTKILKFIIAFMLI